MVLGYYSSSDGNDIQNALSESYASSGTEDTAFIVLNKRANAYNHQIRSRILF